MDFKKETIGERLRAVRIERGINAVEIAKAVGISKSAMSQIESGNVIPSMQTLFAVCQLLDISADYLLGLSDNPDSHKD